MASTAVRAEEMICGADQEEEVGGVHLARWMDVSS